MKVIPALFVSACIAIGFPEDPRAQQSPAAGTKEIVLSLPPAELIRLLPPAPENWKLTTSSARSEITAHPALQTLATRDYVFVPPPEPSPSGQAAAEPAPPKKTRVMLLDTGFDPANFFAFQNFKPDSVGSAGTKKYRVGEIRVVEVVRGAKRTLSVAVSDRFLAALILENQDDKEVAAWLGRLNLPALAPASESAPRLKIPQGSLPIASIDEFQPQANQTTLVSYMTKEEEAARQNAYDKWAEEYLKSRPELQAAIEKEIKEQGKK